MEFQNRLQIPIRDIEIDRLRAFPLGELFTSGICIARCRHEATLVQRDSSVEDLSR